MMGILIVRAEEELTTFLQVGSAIGEAVEWLPCQEMRSISQFMRRSTAADSAKLFKNLNQAENFPR